MLEQMRRPSETFGRGPGGLGDVFAPNTDAPSMVTVVHGPYTEELPLSNMTVGNIRARFRDRLEIHPESQAVIDGHDVGDETIVHAGQMLMFTHRAGEKGQRVFSRIP